MRRRVWRRGREARMLANGNTLWPGGRVLALRCIRSSRCCPAPCATHPTSSQALPCFRKLLSAAPQFCELQHVPVLLCSPRSSSLATLWFSPTYHPLCFPARPVVFPTTPPKPDPKRPNQPRTMHQPQTICHAEHFPPRLCRASRAAGPSYSPMMCSASMYVRVGVL